MHGIRLVEPEEPLRRRARTRGDAASVQSKASRASSPQSKGRGRLSVSFAEEAARGTEPATPGHHSEAFSFSALSNDWSSIDIEEATRGLRNTLNAPFPRNPLGGSPPPAAKRSASAPGFGSPPPGRSRAARRPATVGGGAKPAALERPRCHSSWRFPAERVRGPLLGSPSRFRPQTTSASYERTRRRAPHAFEVTELIESLRRPHAEPTPEEALRTLVRDRVARAYTGCWDACRGLDEGWAASRVLANVDHARLATRGWSRVLGGGGSSTPLKTCPDVKLIRHYASHLEAIRDALDLFGDELLGPDFYKPFGSRATWISDTPFEPTAFERTRRVVDALRRRLSAPVPPELHRATRLLELVSSRAAAATAEIAAAVAIAAAAAGAAETRARVSSARRAALAVQKLKRLFFKGCGVCELLNAGRVANAVRVARDVRAAGWATGAWPPGSEADPAWLDRIDAYRAEVAGSIYSKGSRFVADPNARGYCCVNPRSDNYEIIVKKASGATVHRQRTYDGMHAVSLDRGKIPPGDYLVSVVETTTMPQYDVLVDEPMTVDVRGNAHPAILTATLRVVQINVWKGNEPVADGFKLSAKFEPEAASELADAPPPFRVKGTIDGAGACYLTLPGGKLSDISVMKGQVILRKPRDEDEEPIFFPASDRPLFAWAMEQPKVVTLSLDATDVLAGCVDLVAPGGKCIVLDLDTLRDDELRSRASSRPSSRASSRNLASPLGSRPGTPVDRPGTPGRPLTPGERTKPDDFLPIFRPGDEVVLLEGDERTQASAASPLTEQPSTLQEFPSTFASTPGVSEFPSVDHDASFETPKEEPPLADEDALFRATMKSSVFNFLSAAMARGVPAAFSNWDDGVYFPWTGYGTTAAELEDWFEFGAAEPVAANAMFAEPTDVFLMTDCDFGSHFNKARLDDFVQKYPEINFHFVVVLRHHVRRVSKAVQEIANKGTGAVVFVTLPPHEEPEPEAPAPTAYDLLDLNLAKPTMDAEQLDDLWDSI